MLSCQCAPVLTYLDLPAFDDGCVELLSGPLGVVAVGERDEAEALHEHHIMHNVVGGKAERDREKEKEKKRKSKLMHPVKSP